MKFLFFAFLTFSFLFSGIRDTAAQRISKAKAMAVARRDDATPLRNIERAEYTYLADGTPCWKVSEKINLRKCYRNAHSGMNYFNARVLYISAANAKVLLRDKEFRGGVHINPSF
ncbi:MAG: hypothetical protein ACT6QS_05180 [Flavobacteriales bacterium]